MSRPPIKAMQSIKNYCEKTQCRRCVFGYTVDLDTHYVECLLTERTPCDWDTPIEKEENEQIKEEDND